MDSSSCETMIRLKAFNVENHSMMKTLPKELTSYDLLKTLAVLLMIVDHVGFFYFPDDGWLRVIGRLCVPMWFFLIGYARSRDIDMRLLGGTAILVMGSALYGHYIFPFSILATIIFLRLTMDGVLHAFMHSKLMMILIGAALMVLIIPTNSFLEYGTMGYILAFLGYFVRHNDEAAYNKTFISKYIMYAFFTFVLTQAVFHGFDTPQFVVLSVGIISVLFGLTHFKSKIINVKMPTWCISVLQFTGRRTLEIYVAHILFLGFSAMALGDPRFGLLDWKWIPPLW